MEESISVVVLGPQDWRDLRAIRLEALRSEPAAYSSSYEVTIARSDEHWRQRLANDQSVHLLARAQNRPIGMIGGYLGSDEGDDSVAVVFGMYVASEHRGRGVGRLLLTSLIDRLSAFPQITTIRLGVTRHRTRLAGCTSRWASRLSARRRKASWSISDSMTNWSWSFAFARIILGREQRTRPSYPLP